MLLIVARTGIAPSPIVGDFLDCACRATDAESGQVRSLINCALLRLGERTTQTGREAVIGKDDFGDLSGSWTLQNEGFDAATACRIGESSSARHARRGRARDSKSDIME